MRSPATLFSARLGSLCSLQQRRAPAPLLVGCNILHRCSLSTRSEPRGVYAAQFIAPYLLNLAGQPFVSDIAHCFVFTILDPCHEITVEFEMVAALSNQETPYILRILVRCVHWCRSLYWIAVPIKLHDLFPLSKRGAGDHPLPPCAQHA